MERIRSCLLEELGATSRSHDVPFEPWTQTDVYRANPMFAGATREHRMCGISG
jgi:hypothetical protein